MSLTDCLLLQKTCLLFLTEEGFQSSQTECLCSAFQRYTFSSQTKCPLFLADTKLFLFLSIQNVLCFWLTAHSIFVLCRPDLSCSWCDGMLSPFLANRIFVLDGPDDSCSWPDRMFWQTEWLSWAGYSIRLLFRTRQNVHCSYSWQNFCPWQTRHLLCPDGQNGLWF